MKHFWYHKRSCVQFKLYESENQLNKDALIGKLEIIDTDRKQLQERLKLPTFVDWTTVVMKKLPEKYELLLKYLMTKVNGDKSSANGYTTWLQKHILRVMLLVNYISIYSS